MKTVLLVMLSVSLVLGAAVPLLLSPTAAADTTQSVIPIVHVVTAYSGALTLDGDVDDGWLDFGYVLAGGDAVTRTLNLNVSANAGWQVTVTSTQNLAIGGYEGTKYIPAENFTFTSSGGAGPVYVTTHTPFRTGEDIGQQVVSVVSSGPPDDSFQVDVSYRLTVPPGQEEGSYSANSHVYTLIVGN